MLTRSLIPSLLVTTGLSVAMLWLPDTSVAQEYTMKTKIVSINPKIVEESWMHHGIVVGVRKVEDHANAGPEDPPQTVTDAVGEFPDGEYWEFHPSGQWVQYFKPYKNGLKDGLYKEMEDGQIIKLSVKYKEGRKNGPLTIYHPGSNEAKMIIPYVENIQEGEVKLFLANGKLEMIENFKRGAAQPFQKTRYEYDPEGNTRMEHFFDFDTAGGHRKYFREDGTVDWEVGLNGDQLVDYKRYTGSGKILEDHPGPFNGDIPTYYASGELMQNDHYRNGYPAGFTMYDLRGRVLMKSR